VVRDHAFPEAVEQQLPDPLAPPDVLCTMAQNTLVTEDNTKDVVGVELVGRYPELRRGSLVNGQPRWKKTCSKAIELDSCSKSADISKQRPPVRVEPGPGVPISTKNSS
jgi:hypothetical protein